MRIWDLDPGFLNDKSLLGEHRELHGLFSIHVNNKKGYASHPETRRWNNALSGLSIRHELLVCEMRLRDFNHQSPLKTGGQDAEGCRPVADWPETFIDSPEDQFLLLKEKYQNKPQGRIPLPSNISAVWACHKYSVMARDPELYKTLGPKVAKKEIPFPGLCRTLVEELRKPPPQGRLVNALDHMWGYVSDISSTGREELSPAALLKEIQHKAKASNITYLLHSTALGELGLWAHP